MRGVSVGAGRQALATAEELGRLAAPFAQQLAAQLRAAGGAPPPPPPRTKWTRRVLHPVLIGHAAAREGLAAGGSALTRGAAGRRGADAAEISALVEEVDARAARLEYGRGTRMGNGREGGRGGGGCRVMRGVRGAQARALSPGALAALDRLGAILRRRVPPASPHAARPLARPPPRA